MGGKEILNGALGAAGEGGYGGEEMNEGGSGKAVGVKVLGHGDERERRGYVCGCLCWP